MRIELPLPPATGEGWDEGDAYCGDAPIPTFPHVREGRSFITLPMSQHQFRNTKLPNQNSKKLTHRTILPRAL
jgi:hypothetical protein